MARRRSDSPKAPLGELELLVLLAVLQAGDGAYGSRIRDELERRAGRRVARGALYVTLDRLENKGYLLSRLADANDLRGGSPRRYYRVHKTGLQAIRRTLAALERMGEGLEPLLGRS